ncbi:hypothetical protein [Kitasatospora camelliae]|uniref:Uncharacterized protein n=1 Tax=Kitasatospora camelliae TaxID=3156397 RepID=A0AAU8JT87_9ACTN
MRLTIALRQSGPVGAAGYLARATAHAHPDQAAGTLAELRRSGLTDEAAELFHALWAVPAVALPGLLAALERAGQPADGQTLLWEWASAPPAELSVLADELHASGRMRDLRSLLRQVAGRPVGEIAAVVTALESTLAAHLIREVSALRSASDLGGFGATLAQDASLYGALLAAIAELDESRFRNALAALRSLGLPTEPPRGRGRR